MIKLRYIFGIPFLYTIGFYGANVLFWALIIGVWCWFIDEIDGKNNGNGPLPS